MNRIMKWLGTLAALICIMVSLGYAGMRLNDGPVEFVPGFTISIGGPFRSGEPTDSPSSWSFIKDVEEIEMQTLNLSTTKTVWPIVVEGRLFVASGRLNTRVGRLWKQWPQRIEEDDRIILRIDEKLYEQRMVRILQGPEIVPVMTEISRKYGNGAPGSELAVTGGYVWLFEVVER